MTDYVFLNKEFDKFADAMDRQLHLMLTSGNPIVKVAVEESLFSLYLENIAPEHNPIFRERRYFDGNYDHNYIRRLGNIAMITPDYKRVTLWDFETDTIFEDARKAMQVAVQNGTIVDAFLEKEKVAGHKPNADAQEPSIIWQHYYAELPKEFVNTRNIDTVRGKHRDAVAVLKRTVEEVNLDDLHTVLDLIASNAIYRGAEFKEKLESWVGLKQRYDQTPTQEFLWYEGMKHGRALGHRNTVIGSLLTDLYNGDDLEKAVKAYEARVAPSNYKRPTALVTPKMIQEAEEKLRELGYLDSIYRRPAKLTDLPADKLLFTSQEQKSLSVFDDLTKDAKASTKKVDPETAQDITLEQLYAYLPECSQVELLPTANLKGNQMVLTAAKDESAPSPFLWSNTLSWAYINGDTADAIAMRVKNAGGEIDADVRVSLSWENADDLDLHIVRVSNKQHLYYGNPRQFGAVLDVDANAFNIVEEPVENIFWDHIENMPNGTYQVYVDRYSHRRDSNVGFDIQFATRDSSVTYHHRDNNVNRRKTLITLVKDAKGVRVENVHGDLVETATSVTEATFIPVKHILLSPNMWDGEIGNKHVFLLTDDVVVDQPVRGFFNEQLESKLASHRKVTEILGTKLKLEASEFDHPDVAKGYGFSSTMDANFILRLTKGRQRVLVHVSVK